MYKFINNFDTTVEYTSAKTQNPVTPSVSLVKRPWTIHYDDVTIQYGIEVWTDLLCTQRPVVGEEYSTLYVKLNKAYGFDEWYTSPLIGSAVCSAIVVNTPTSEYPDDPYCISLYVDFVSYDFSRPFVAGDIIECCGRSYTNPELVRLDSPLITSFDPYTT